LPRILEYCIKPFFNFYFLNYFGRATAGLGVCGGNMLSSAAIGVGLSAVVLVGDGTPKLSLAANLRRLWATAPHPSRS